MSDIVPNPPTPPAWHAGLEADYVPHMQGRGWDKLTPDQAALQAIKAHREAEKLIGVPAENILRKPKDAADAENWAKINEVRGVPKDAKDYDFTGVKFTDGTELQASFADALRASASKYAMSKDDAKGMASDIVKLIEAGETADTAEYTEKLNAEKEALKVNWGANNYAANLIVAQRGMQAVFTKMGLPEDRALVVMSNIEKSLGYKDTMEFFRNVGVGTGEDKFVSNGGNPDNGAMTKEQAQAELDMIQKDEIWMKKFNDGDTAAVRKFHNLTQLIAG